MPSTSSLAKKLSEIANEIGRVPKNGYNSFHKYQYVLEADLVDHIRPILAKHNIFILPRVGQWSESEGAFAYAHTQDGELSTIIYEYDIIDGDSGEKLTTSSVGYGSDRGDKGAYKASTGAFKYMLMRLFMVATGDDPEGDERTDQRAGGTGPNVNVTPSSARPVGRGGRSDGATNVQINRIKQTSKEMGLGVGGMQRLIERVLGDALVLPDGEVAASGVISDYLDGLSSDDIGKLLAAMVNPIEEEAE